MWLLIVFNGRSEEYPEGLVSVSRWTLPGGGTYIHRDGIVTSSWYAARGHSNRVHLYYAYMDKPTHDEELAVQSVRWRRRTINDKEDWVIAAEGEHPDSWWNEQGHDAKTAECWVFRQKPENPPAGFTPVRVFKVLNHMDVWVTVVEGTTDEKLQGINDDLKDRQFLFWALKRIETGVDNIGLELLAKKEPMVLLINGPQRTFYKDGCCLDQADELLQLFGDREMEVVRMRSDELEAHIEISDKVRKMALDRSLIIIGHGYGGGVAIELARNLKRQVLFLGLLDPVSQSGKRAALVNEEIPANVVYFYNRWQNIGAFPIDFRVPGWIKNSQARRNDQKPYICDHDFFPSDGHIQEEIIESIQSLIPQ